MTTRKRNNLRALFYFVHVVNEKEAMSLIDFPQIGIRILSQSRGASGMLYYLRAAAAAAGAMHGWIDFGSNECTSWVTSTIKGISSNICVFLDLRYYLYYYWVRVPELVHNYFFIR